MSKKKVYVLDSCALIAYFRHEDGSLNVADLFEKAMEKKCTIYIHRVSIAEVYYDTLRTSNKNKAEQMLKDLILIPILFLNGIDDNFIKQVGLFKVNHKVSFADCFVLASAVIKKATIITSDHHEFGSIEKSGILSFNWIR